MDSQEQITLRMLIDAVKEHPLAVIITLIAGLVGAFVGGLAYYNGWLG